MIKYALKCDDGHKFESWFQSSDAYDRLIEAGHLSCAVCGSVKVAKDIMAPKLSSNLPAVPEATPKAPLSEPTHPAEAALRQLRKKIEENADDVGRQFASEARRIHAGDAPERAIYGEARPDEAKALLDDGVPVMPLPFRVGKPDQ